MQRRRPSENLFESGAALPPPEVVGDLVEVFALHSPLSTADLDIVVPDVAMINHVLAEHDAGYEIQPPNLIARDPSIAIAVPERTATLDKQAQDIIQQSLRQSDQYLALGQYRQAVQEILWLLETVSTIFQDITGGEAGAAFVEGLDEERRMPAACCM